jgi:hypothetical protein
VRQNYWSNTLISLGWSSGKNSLTRAPVESLAHLLMGAITEAAIFIAHAGDKPAARRQVGENVAQLLAGLRIDHKRG